MDFGALPPEINSGRMYAGPGSGPMLAAAAAWDGLAAQLQTTAAAYSSVISGLTSVWRGPSSVTMAGAVIPYLAWMTATAAQAEQTAAQAREAAVAYETAFAATVPPPVIAANRGELASLVATNTFGQNTPAIAANEARYGEMWAQDAAAMYNYAGQSAAASTVTPFAMAPATTDPSGLIGQLAAIVQTFISSVASSAQRQFSQLFAAVPTALQSFATIVTGPQPISGLLSAAQSFAGMQTLNSVTADIEVVPKLILPVNDVLITAIFGCVVTAKGIQASASSAGGIASAAAALGSSTQLVGSTGTGSAVSASVGRGGLVGAMSVPQGWASATPAVRTVASVLSGSAAAAAPAAQPINPGVLMGGMALAGMGGSLAGGMAPRLLGRADAGGGAFTLKDGSLNEAESSENLQRVAAEMADQPGSVQHWHTDSAQLESLIARLSTQPGIHAVHLDDGQPNTTNKVMPPKAW